MLARHIPAPGEQAGQLAPPLNYSVSFGYRFFRWWHILPRRIARLRKKWFGPADPPTCPDCGNPLDSVNDEQCTDCMVHSYHDRQLEQHLDPGGEGAREADGDINAVWGQLGVCDLCGEKSGDHTRYYRLEFGRRSGPAEICECCEYMIVTAAKLKAVA